MAAAIGLATARDRSSKNTRGDGRDAGLREIGVRAGHERHAGSGALIVDDHGLGAGRAHEQRGDARQQDQHRAAVHSFLQR